MKTHGTPNKYNIFQQFYLQQNGVALSYNDAVDLFHKMDTATKNEFNEFYRDEVGYEIVNETNPYTTPSGYNLDGHFRDMTNKYSGVKTKKIKVKQSDGTIKYETKEIKNWEPYNTPVTQNAVHVQYSIKAYIQSKGINIEDSKWLIYSAEEILQMESRGVNIPQNILDIAHTILESTGTTYNTNGTDENDGIGELTTEKEPFLELIPKTEKHIEKCNDKREKIEDKIENLLNQNKKDRKTLFEKQQNQLEELEEFEKNLREWRLLQDKINNGEELTDTEARKYAEITGMLEDKNNSDDFKFNKNKIAMSLNDINILAVLGEKIANETIVMGETLADYTSQYNYKNTQKTVSGEIGFLRAIVAMATGKSVAKEAVQIGNETLNFTDDTSQSINDIAQILGIESMIANPAKGESELTNEPGKAKVAENEVQMGTDDDTSNVHNDSETDNQTESAEHENTTSEEDFLVNDENILQLIDEAGDIHTDLKKIVTESVIAINDAKNDLEYTKQIEQIVNKLVEEYQKEEAQRQEIIQKLQQENNDYQKEIDEMNNENSENNSELPENTKNEIRNKQEQINQNHIKIENINSEKEISINEFKENTKNYSARVKESIPAENKNLTRDTDYKDNLIPQYSKELNFTEKNGGTLYKMGKYRIAVGTEMFINGLLSPELRKRGQYHITRGTQSTIIGSDAQTIGAIPTDDEAIKATGESTQEENNALNSLYDIDNKITSVTGDKSEKAQETNDPESDNNSNNEQVTDKAAVNNNESTTKTSQTKTQTPVQDTTKTPIVKNSTGILNDENNKPSKRLIRGREEKTHYDIPEPAQDVMTKSSGTKNKKDDKQMSTDDAQSSVDNIKNNAEETGKDSEQVKKDTEKDEKQLNKETKALQKQMKKDEQEIIKKTKESIRAAKKQAEIITKYEALVTENDEIVAKEEKKKAQAPSATSVAMQSLSTISNTSPQAANAAAQPTDSAENSTSENAAKLQENDLQIAMLGNVFNMHGKTITRNRTRILKLQKTTKTNTKKYNAKTKIRQTKIKETEKKEVEKQQKLAKQLATVGVAENIFSITMATGAILMLSPWTAAVGKIMFNIGRFGVIACGLTKAVINFANGNATAALIGLGQTAVSVAGAMGTIGEMGNTVLTAVSSGMQVVASSAELVNNVRTLEGKEASGIMNKISTIAGVISSTTSAASGLTALEKGDSFGKIAGTIGNSVGTALSSTSQIMSEFDIGDEQLATIFGNVGGAVSTMSGIVSMVASKKETADNTNNNDAKEEVKNENNEPKARAQQKREGENTDQTNPDKANENQKSETQRKDTQNNNTQTTDNNTNNTEQTNNTKQNDTEKKIEQAVNNNLNVSDVFKNIQSDSSINSIEVDNVVNAVNNVTTNNDNKMSALEAQNTNNKDNQIKSIDLPDTSLRLDKQIKAEIEAKLDDPKMMAKIDELSKAIDSQRIEEFKTTQRKETKNEKIIKNLETFGNTLQAAPTILETLGLLSENDVDDEIERAYASSGAQYLTGHHKFHSEQVKDDYRKEAKKKLRKVNALAKSMSKKSA